MRRTWSRLGLVATVFAACLASLLLVPPRTAHAHPADMYAQNLAITIAADGLRIDWQILPGPFLADAVWAAADTDQDGLISAAEAQAWIAPFLSGLSIQLDGRPLTSAGSQDVHWPATVDVLRTAEDRIQLTLRFAWPANATGAQTLEIHSAHLERNSLNWFSLTAEEGLSFDQPQQDNGLLRTTIAFPADQNAQPPAAALTSWNSGTPNLPGFGAAVSTLSQGLTGSGQASSTAAAAGSVTSTLTSLVKTQQFSPWFLAGAFLLSLALGSLHALTPGHGKALVGAYLVGSQGTTRDAVLLGSIVTITHTGSVVLLGLITLLASHYILPALIAPWLEIVSGLLVIGFGLNLLFRRRRDLAAWLSRPHGASGRDPTGKLAPHDHDAHDHAHAAHDHGPAGHVHHEHTHDHPPAGAGVLAGGSVTFKSLLTLGISGGLVPCPDAIAILLVAVAVNRVPFGILLIISFSIGLALILIAIGIAMVKGLRLVTRSDLLSRFAVYTPVLSAVVVTGLGAALTVSAYNSLKFGSTVARSAAGPSAALRQVGAPALPASGFDLSGASLLYITSDSTGWDQLYMQRLAGGEPVQYTHEPSGITGYSISPDGKTILFTLFGPAGGTAIWAVNADGTGKRVILDCPDSECDSPRWYPDSNKIAYDRLDNATEATVPRFSIWWLDLASGETRPVFQDQSFASYAPEFSPDGKWLSYISTADNTLILYDLQGGASRSIPLGLQAALPATWSPDGGTVLFASEAEGETGVRTRTYSLASAQTTDLGGSPDTSDYSAVWSPDGSWIAIDRNVASGPAHSNNQVWLVKPDGSQPHVLLQEQGASYSSLNWSRDGRYLLYSRYVLDLSAQSPGHFDIYVVDVVTGQSKLLITGGDMPSFLP